MKTFFNFSASMILIVLLLCGCGSSIPQQSATTSNSLPLETNTPISPTPTNTRTPVNLLPVRGLYVQFERRGWSSEWWSGQVISDFNSMDDVVGYTVAEEVSLQLDQIKMLGVNTIAFELRSSAATYDPGQFIPPNCNISPALGLQYPQPTETELDNLVAFLDLVQSKEMKVFLRLVNTHMEGQPTSENETWLGSILKQVGNHPALDLVLFEGSPFLVDTNGDSIMDSCGGPAEPGLWEGPDSISGNYVRWAINYAHSLGVPYRKLSAQAIVGNYYVQMQPANPFMTDGHFWDPVQVQKIIFDGLEVPENERTYALSFYEHRKCSDAAELPCEDLNPHQWAMETANGVFDVIGRGNGARVVAVEMGLLPPAEPGWTTEQALESLVWVMQTTGIDGGCFWRWTSFDNGEDADPSLALPIKLRGEDYRFTPVKEVLERLYTFGLVSEPDFSLKK